MFKVIDDVLPQRIFQRIQKQLMLSNFDVRPSPTGTYRDEYTSFGMPITPETHPAEFELFLVAFMLMADKAELEYERMFRIRVGLITRDIEQISHMPHIDHDREHNVALLYLNDTDGDTMIWNETHNWNRKYVYKSLEDVTLYESVTPKENRVVFFSGNRYHSSTTPSKTQLRWGINYNYI